jgi:hypothetical protein
MNQLSPEKLLSFIVAAAGAPDYLSASESPGIGDLKIFPADNPWNWDISAHPVHPNSDNFIASIGKEVTLHPDFGTVWNGAPNGIPYVVVTGGQARVPVVYTAYGDESDSGPFPTPLVAPVEGGPDGDGDRHVIAVDVDNAMLYEQYRAFPQDDNWEAESGAVFDLTRNEVRPAGWTSTDATGLPIFHGTGAVQRSLYRQGNRSCAQVHSRENASGIYLARPALCQLINGSKPAADGTAVASEGRF